MSILAQAKIKIVRVPIYTVFTFRLIYMDQPDYTAINDSDDNMVIGESRTELLQWLNATLDLQYTKVESCGTGAAYCQLMDSIVGGIPMTKVKFDAQTEYDYIHNFKILQASFNKHKVNKTIDVQRLIKCRLQDNLVLLQWFKKYWHENKDVNGTYDAISRRKVSGLGANSAGGSSMTPQVRSRTSSESSQGSRRTTLTSRVSSGGRMSITPNTPTNTTGKMAQLNKELTDTAHELAIVSDELLEYKILAESLETERNFYFNKLREIEILTENLKNLDESEFNNLSMREFVEKIQTILYSTEEGFQSNSDQVEIDSESF